MIPVEEFEKQLGTKRSNLIVVVNHVNGPQVCGIFTTMEKATMYVTRNSINMTIDVTADDSDCEFEDDTPKISKNNFIEMYNSMVSDYVYIGVNHLNPAEPIYALQSGNFRIRGNSVEYLTNDKLKATKYYKEQYDLNNCVFKIDPELDNLTDAYIN